MSATLVSSSFVVGYSPSARELGLRPRFEPGTYSLEGCCSIQLSYGTKIAANIVNFEKFLKIFEHSLYAYILAFIFSKNSVNCMQLTSNNSSYHDQFFI